MPTAPVHRWVVLKFGGTSVSSAGAWGTIARVVGDRVREGLRPVVVCSALAGVTNELERLLREAVAGAHGPVLEAIRARHRELGRSLGVDADGLLGAELEELERTALGISLLREATPQVHARAVAKGEILATRLGAAFLAGSGVPTAWIDARECLRSEEQGAGPHRHYLAAVCSADVDPELQTRLGAEPAAALLTQGFIARDARGDTVLLGRGGSDTSAAYFAAMLAAVRCEIWTDVPGVYSADPRQVPEARLIRRLDYDEAQEIASTGGKVLHPRCLAPLRRRSIPLQIRATPHPDAEGTLIAPGEPDRGAEVKAIASRAGIKLVSMETVGMWQQVGFLADVFARFREHGLSIDMVSTSETNVTVSLDPLANALDPEAVAGLLESLSGICRARMIGPCAAVSLVGRNIRGVLPRLGPALEAFEEQRIHLVSQAASDLNLTFVVDEDQAERLVRRLHELLFGGRVGDPLLGSTWRELSAGSGPAAERPAAPWWVARRERLLALAAEHAPCYVYHAGTIDAAVEELRSIGAVERILYAIKANPHAAVLERLEKAGVGFECASEGEVEHVLDLFPGIDPKRLLFTPNFAPRGEYEAAFARGVPVTVDNVYPLAAWPETFRGREMFLRIDPGEGHGHHRHVRTAGAGTKFGIPVDLLDEAARRAREIGARVVGLHAHAGSGILSAESWCETALFLASAAERFPDLRALDLGGGLGVPERPGQAGVDLGSLGERLREVRATRPGVALWLEPGRFLVARAGVLLARVTQLKRKGDLVYVGVETGMNSLIRPALYGSWHEIVNLTRLHEPATTVADVVGPICESGDVLGHGRFLAAPQEGDVILIATTGAYGRSMSSRYNLREPARELMLEED